MCIYCYSFNMQSDMDIYYEDDFNFEMDVDLDVDTEQSKPTGIVSVDDHVCNAYLGYIFLKYVLVSEIYLY